MPPIYGIMGGMEKTTVYLTTAQKAALARAAEAEGRSEARLIRSGIDLVTAGHRAAEARAVPLADAPEPPRQHPPLERPRWIEREVFLRLVLPRQADAGLRADLRALAPGTTEDEPIP
jgi:hypothetical protein